MIKLIDIQKSYDNFTVLDKLNVLFSPGEIVGLLGENGVGKTTLLRIISGISNNYGGQLLHNNKAIHDLAKYKAGIGFLSEKNPLYPHMYVKEYLAYIALHYDLTNIKERVEDVIEKVGIGEKSHLRISQLSKGFKQRVGLAAAIIHDPRILILDEPINGLDPKQILQYRLLLQSMKKDRVIILSSHLLQEIEALCDKIIFISEGAIAKVKYLENKGLSDEMAFVVKTAKPIITSELLMYPSITAIEDMGEYEYRIKSNPGEDCRKDIFSYLSDSNNYILELSADEYDLNQLFFDE